MEAHPTYEYAHRMHYRAETVVDLVIANIWGAKLFARHIPEAVRMCGNGNIVKSRLTYSCLAYGWCH